MVISLLSGFSITFLTCLWYPIAPCPSGRIFRLGKRVQYFAPRKIPQHPPTQPQHTGMAPGAYLSLGKSIRSNMSKKPQNLGFHPASVQHKKTWSLLLTLQKWLVMTRNLGVIDPFMIRVRRGRLQEAQNLGLEPSGQCSAKNKNKLGQAAALLFLRTLGRLRPSVSQQIGLRLEGRKRQAHSNEAEVVRLEVGGGVFVERWGKVGVRLKMRETETARAWRKRKSKAHLPVWRLSKNY